MADEHKTPLDQALDLLIYGPLGLAATARDEMPRLVEKGRQQVTSQVALARMIGQFVVTQGQKEAEKAAARLADQAEAVLNRRRASDTPEPASSPADSAASATPAAAPPAPAPTPTPAAPPVGNGTAPITRATAVADDLAIPGYDNLSASQVVQRLDGLSVAELEAVRAYEAASRGRRTILSKVAQLQGKGS